MWTSWRKGSGREAAGERGALRTFDVEENRQVRAVETKNSYFLFRCGVTSFTCGT